jgi:inner membrane protein
MEKPSLFDRFNNWVKNSFTIKLLSIGFLILILLIPTSMLESLIRERQMLHDDATTEISSKWGSSQTLAGPILSIPYTAAVKDEKGNIEYMTRYAHFLPKELSINGTLAPEKRYRGIYVVILYKSMLHIEGKLEYPDVTQVGLKNESCHFDQAFISFGITDLKGINDQIKCNINDKSFQFGPGIPSSDILNSGVSFKYPLDSLKQLNFSFDLNLNGSSSINFLPFGEETHVKITSNWGNPKFAGAFLPDNRIINDTGFTASWKVLQLNRNYPQQGTGSFVGTIGHGNNRISEYEDDAYTTNSSDFGVQLILPVNEYQKTIRSVKYCVMFLILTFLTFFFVEVLNKKRIHPIQYLLVGFAICLFYVLLLSISEQINFGKAYLVSCIAIIALITYYVSYIFKKPKLTILFSAILTILYGFFYSLLQLEDYSLLMGSAGLFLILSTIMYLTKRVNWYGSER